MKKLLIIVDYQNDFVDGALGFAGAEKLEPGILEKVEEYLSGDGFVLFTRDTHSVDYLETREGKHLPIPHCVEGEHGHALYGRLHKYQSDASGRVELIDKPTFGSPDIGVAAEQLCKGEPDEITLCGLVTDICVIANAILLHSFFPSADIRVLESLVGSGNRENAQAALAVLRGMGVEVVD